MHPTFEQLAPILAGFGLPPLAGIHRAGSSGALTWHRLSFEGKQGDLLLTRQRWPTGFDPLERQAAAVTALLIERIPCPVGLQLLPLEALGMPASITSVAWSSTEHPLSRHLEAMGRAIEALADIYLPNHGTRADSGAFAPRRAGWQQDWLAFTSAHHSALVALGLGSLPAVQRLWERVQTGAASLPGNVPATPIHFDLRPYHLTLDEQGTWVGLGGLQHALAGDALATWAPLLGTLRGDHLRTVLEAAHESVDALAARSDALHVYAATHALSGLRDAAQRQAFEPTRAATRTFERALALAGTVAEPTYVEHRLQEATARSTAPAPRPDRPGSAELRALLALGASPLLPTNRAIYLLAALGSHALADTAPLHAAHFEDVAHAFLDAADLPTGRLTAALADDAWRERTLQAVRSAGGGGPGLAVALLARARTGLDRWEGAVGAGCTVGLEALLLAVTQRERAQRAGGSLSPHQRVLHGLLGAHGARSLGLDDLVPLWLDQVSSALELVDGHTPPRPEATSDLQHLLPAFARDFRYPGDGRLVLAAVDAAAHLHTAGVLKAPVARVLRACAALLEQR